MAALLLSRRAHLLTTHKMGGGIPFGVVRSARRMRLLREPYGQCHNPKNCCPCPRSRQSVLLSQNRRFHFGNALPSACENLPPAALSQIWVSLFLRHPFSLLQKRNRKQKRKNEVNVYGDLSLGGKGSQPW